MVNTKISQLASGSAVADADVFPAVETAGTGPVKKLASQIKTYILSSIGTVWPFSFFEGGWWSHPVAVLRPTGTNKGMTLDISPNGTAQDCWIDIASTDVQADINNYETLNLSKLAGGAGYVECEAAGTGVVRDLHFQSSGGNVAIGPTISPQNRLDVNGSAAFGTYGGNFAAPSGGILVSGDSGFGTSSPSAKLTVAASGNILSCQDTAQREIASFNSNGTIAAGNNVAGVNGILKLGTPSGYELVLTGKISDGHATVNNANLVGGNIDIQSQGTTAISIRPSGVVVMASLPTANPHVVGQLWNNSGAMNISSG